MICLRCGHCCKNYCVMIVDDSDLGLREGNIIFHSGEKSCKHLVGDGPGNYYCVLHGKEWYKDTPCFAHTQIEDDVNTLCRVGVYVMKQAKEER